MSIQRMGDMLRGRREELGYGLEQAAEMTNIRSRVLEAFEGGDYANFPPAGYAQGMLSSYARFLGLDPQRVIAAYEHEYSSYSERAEMEKTASRARRGLGRFGEHRASGVQPKARKQMAPTTGEIPVQADSRAALEHIARNDDRYKSGSVKVVNSRPHTSASGRLTRGSSRASAALPSRSQDSTGARYPDHPRAQSLKTATSQGTGKQGAVAASGASPATGSTHSARFGRLSDDHATGNLHAGRSLETGSGATQDEPYASGAAAKRARRRRAAQQASDAPGGVQGLLAPIAGIFKETRTRLIAIAAILLVIAVIVAANMLISTAGDDSSGVLPVQGGAEDTTSTKKGSKDASATITTTNGTPVSVHIEVAEHKTSLVNVTFDDDNAYSGTAVGPWSRDFQVTESMTATFGTPDAVSVTENGNEVEIDRKDDGTGVVTLIVESASTADEDDA